MTKSKILIALAVTALQLMAAAPVFAQESPKVQQQTPDEKILTGLVKVTREPRKHWYTPHFRGNPTFKVQTASGFSLYSEEEFKAIKKAYKRANNESFPDLRSYEDQHPKWVKTQTGFKHWNPVLQGSSNFIIPAGVLVGGYMAGKTKQTVQVNQ